MPSHSLLYNTLGTLEEQGFITSEKDYKGEVERTVYSITKEGHADLEEQTSQFAKMLSQMMKAASERPFPKIPRVFLEHMEPEDRKEFLQQIRSSLEVALQEVEKELSTFESE
jgi:DNA-binding PadR family transcriptional regulator